VIVFERVGKHICFSFFGILGSKEEEKGRISEKNII
jgi:hypothetical protein